MSTAARASSGAGPEEPASATADPAPLDSPPIPESSDDLDAASPPRERPPGAHAAMFGTSAPAASSGFMVPRSPSLPFMYKYSSPAAAAAAASTSAAPGAPDPGRTNRARYLGSLGFNPRSTDRAPRQGSPADGSLSAAAPLEYPSRAEEVGPLEHPLSPCAEGFVAPSEDTPHDGRQLSTEPAGEAAGAQRARSGSRQSSFALAQSAVPVRRARSLSQSRSAVAEGSSSGIANLLRSSSVAVELSPRAADGAGGAGGGGGGGREGGGGGGGGGGQGGGAGGGGRAGEMNVIRKGGEADGGVDAPEELARNFRFV